LGEASAAGYLTGEFSDDLRQMLDLGNAGSGSVELKVVRPQALRRIFNELLDRAAADTQHPDRRQLVRQARDHVFATVSPI